MVESNLIVVTVLFIIENAAGILKGVFRRPEKSEKFSFVLIVVWVLLIVELAANLGLGVLTILRFRICGALTVVALSGALVADVLLWFLEAVNTSIILTIEGDSYDTSDSFVLPILQVAIIGLLPSIPFVVGWIRSLALQPLNECSDWVRGESITILVVAIVLVVFLIWQIFKKPSHGLSRAYTSFLFAMFIIVIAVGVVTSLQPERQVILHAGLMAIPPLFTWALSIAKVYMVSSASSRRGEQWRNHRLNEDDAGSHQSYTSE